MRQNNRKCQLTRRILVTLEKGRIAEDDRLAGAKTSAASVATSHSFPDPAGVGEDVEVDAIAAPTAAGRQDTCTESGTDHRRKDELRTRTHADNQLICHPRHVVEYGNR